MRIVIAYGLDRGGNVVPVYTGNDADDAEAAVLAAGASGKIAKGYLVKNPDWARRYADFGPRKISPETSGATGGKEQQKGQTGGGESGSPAAGTSGADDDDDDHFGLSSGRARKRPRRRQT